MWIVILIAAAATEVDAANLLFDFKPEEIPTACARLEEINDQKISDILAIPADKRTFDNTVLAFEAAITDYTDAVLRLGFMKDIHTDERVRLAGAACEERAGKYQVRLGARKDVYEALEGAQPKSDVDKRLFAVLMRDFKKNGLELDDKKRDKLVQLRQRLTELQTRFARNLDEENPTIEVTKEELAGMPEAFIARLAPSKDGKKVVLTTKYPDYFPIMENAKNESVRKRMQIAFNTRGAKTNLKLLEEAIGLRDEAAKLLGFKTHMDFVTNDRMAQDAETVMKFETRMRDGLKPRLAEETKKLEKLKGGKINSWDWRFYLNELKRAEYAIDDEETRKYFPTDKVVSGMFDVYSTLFGITIEELKDAKVWAPVGVKEYLIRDATTKRTLAKFYMDLYPRPGKYGHGACFPLGLARLTPKGYQIPLSVLVMNFNPGSFSIDEVKTLFHEFGHVVHASLTTAPYASLAGTNVATDFVEAPSQVLENWIFQPEVIAKISTGLPKELADKVIAARRFDAGIKYSRQVFLGTFDAKLHTSGPKVDSDKVSKAEWKAILGFTEDPKEKFPGNFGHMMSGYDGGYYGYLWSEVYAADMFSRFVKEGVMNPKTGKDYRDIILAKGRTEEPMKLLEQFLGRAPNEAAFLAELGIK